MKYKRLQKKYSNTTYICAQCGVRSAQWIYTFECLCITWKKKKKSLSVSKQIAWIHMLMICTNFSFASLAGNIYITYTQCTYTYMYRREHLKMKNRQMLVCARSSCYLLCWFNSSHTRTVCLRFYNFIHARARIEYFSFQLAVDSISKYTYTLLHSIEPDNGLCQ